MSCFLYRVVLEERPSVRVVASAVDGRRPKHVGVFKMVFNKF